MKKMNIHDIRLFIERLGLTIDNWLKFSNFLSIIPLDRLFKDYLIVFINKKTERFFENTKDIDVINLILFEKKISTNFLKWLLFFETRFKKVIIEKWLEFYDLKKVYIYLYSESDFLKFFPDIVNCNDLELKKFRFSLFEHVSNSEFLVEYKKLEEIPLEDLSSSWSFATMINFYRVLDKNLKKEILKEFNIPFDFTDSFHKVLNVLLKVRNTISHNHIIYNFKTNLYKIEFNKIYRVLFKDQLNTSKPISLIQIMKIVDFLLNWNNCWKEFNSEFRELDIIHESKDNLYKIIFDAF